MGKIVAIGGGEIGSPGKPVETTEIDKETIRLSGSKEPRLLFIPTAADDAESYVETIHKHFGKRLGCTIDTLYLIKRELSMREIRGKVFNADIIYVGGGNTLKMLKIWRKYGVDKVLLEAFQRDVVLSGLSAGAICWFRYGSSDSRRFSDPNAVLIKIRGLNFVNALYCPHYDTEKDRKPHLRELMRKTSGVAVAVDNCCAIEILDDSYRVITSKSNANAYKVYRSKGESHEEIIEKKDEFMPIENLTKK